MRSGRYLSIEANLDALMRMREELKAAGTKVSVNDCVIKAAAMALAEVPEANCSWSEVRLRTHRESGEWNCLAPAAASQSHACWHAR
jgi:pyruvate/2-oxoglutarate dehydrogenase complex dihydrolipoamide acyltransferase (E2) component